MPVFDHDCAGDTYVASIGAQVDLYAQCFGTGYIVRYGDDGPDYLSSRRWTLADAYAEAAGIATRFARLDQILEDLS